jgi:hypothetical protein
MKGNCAVLGTTHLNCFVEGLEMTVSLKILAYLSQHFYHLVSKLLEIFMFCVDKGPYF